MLIQRCLAVYGNGPGFGSGKNWKIKKFIFMKQRHIDSCISFAWTVLIIWMAMDGKCVRIWAEIDVWKMKLVASKCANNKRQTKSVAIKCWPKFHIKHTHTHIQPHKKAVDPTKKMASTFAFIIASVAMLATTASGQSGNTLVVSSPYTSDVTCLSDAGVTGPIDAQLNQPIQNGMFTFYGVSSDYAACGLPSNNVCR